MEFIDFYATLAGFFFTLLILWSGVGAGILVIPALIILFNVDPLVAIASGVHACFKDRNDAWALQTRLYRLESSLSIPPNMPAGYAYKCCIACLLIEK